jgi:predicted nucleotidyltransferase
MKIYLFGSRAMGTATDDSDYDLFLIVKNSNKSPTERMREARRLLWGRKVPVDVFVYTEAEFNDYKDEFSSIAHTVATEGVEI